MLRVLDLFSGIGGFSLGLERTGGFRTVAFCEIDPYCRAVLRKHWPDVPCHDDIRALRGERGMADVVCGGFPCQPFSIAGKRRGKADDRHLWPEMARVISEVRPAWVIGENVTGLIGMALDGVLSDLEGMGYALWPVVLPACAVDAPHRRDRLWIVAHAEELQRDGREHHAGSCIEGGSAIPEPRDCGGSEPMADANSAGLSLAWSQSGGEDWGEARRVFAAGRWWGTEPDVGRVAHGVPRRVDRLRALGNAVVPQVVEEIGRAIMRAHHG